MGTQHSWSVELPVVLLVVVARGNWPIMAVVAERECENGVEDNGNSESLLMIESILAEKVGFEFICRYRIEDRYRWIADRRRLWGVESKQASMRVCV